jgi:hypothetical protein
LDGDEDARKFVTERFLSLGGTGNTWRLRPTREAMCNALTAGEDRLEVRGSRFDAVRAGIRAVRRRLELELWS